MMSIFRADAASAASAAGDEGDEGAAGDSGKCGKGYANTRLFRGDDKSFNFFSISFFKKTNKPVDEPFDKKIDKMSLLMNELPRFSEVYINDLGSISPNKSTFCAKSGESHDSLDLKDVFTEAEDNYALYLTSEQIEPMVGNRSEGQIHVSKLKAILVFRYDEGAHCMEIKYLCANQANIYAGAGTKIIEYFNNMINNYVNYYNSKHNTSDNPKKYFLEVCLLSLGKTIGFYLKKNFIFKDEEDKIRFQQLYKDAIDKFDEKFGRVPDEDDMRKIYRDLGGIYMKKIIGDPEGTIMPTQSDSETGSSQSVSEDERDGGAPHTKTKKNKPYNRAKKTKKYKNGKNGKNSKNCKKHNICKRAKKTKKYKNCKKYKFCKRTKKL